MAESVKENSLMLQQGDREREKEAGGQLLNEEFKCKECTQSNFMILGYSLRTLTSLLALVIIP